MKKKNLLGLLLTPSLELYFCALVFHGSAFQRQKKQFGFRCHIVKPVSTFVFGSLLVGIDWLELVEKRKRVACDGC